MARRKFLRGKWRTYSKLGNRRKNKQKYRKAKGRHNKIREKRKGNPRKVEIGYKKQKIQGKEKRIIYTLEQFNKVRKGEEIIISRMGQKKKLEIAKKAKEKGIKILNLNVKKFIKEIENKKKEKEKIKKEKENKKKKEVKKKKQEKKKEKEEKKDEKEDKDKKESSEKEEKKEKAQEDKK